MHKTGQNRANLGQQFHGASRNSRQDILKLLINNWSRIFRQGFDLLL